MKHTPLRRRTVLVAAVVGVAGLLAGCGSSDSATSSGGSGSATAPKVSGAWARTSAAMQNAGAAYMVLENTTDTEDALVKVAVDASVAGTVELHETVAADGAMGSDTTAMGAAGMGSDTTAMGAAGMGSDTTAMGASATTAMGMGAMKMQPVAKIVVPAKGSVELKPGGYHVMLLDLAVPLVAGESFDATLSFESGATATVKIEVRDQA